MRDHLAMLKECNYHTGRDFFQLNGKTVVLSSLQFADFHPISLFLIHIFNSTTTTTTTNNNNLHHLDIFWLLIPRIRVWVPFFQVRATAPQNVCACPCLKPTYQDKRQNYGSREWPWLLLSIIILSSRDHKLMISLLRDSKINQCVITKLVFLL